MLRALALVLGPLVLAPSTSQDEQQDRPAEAVDELAQPDTDAPEIDPAELERIAAEATQAEATEIKSEEAKLAERLRTILAAVPEFRGMTANVDAGIVVLAGTARSRDAATRAVETAELLDGVLFVVDDVEVERSLAVRLGDSWTEVVERLRDLLVALPQLAVGLAIVALAWLLARVLRDVHFLYRVASERILLQNLLRQSVFVGTLVAGLVAALRFVDAGGVIGTILGAAGVVGIALGFAFRNIVENYLAGVLLAIRQPFVVRDVVSIDGELGTVMRMTSSETTLMDADGNHLRLPNAMVFNGKVLNYTRNPLRRFTVAVGVGNDVDLERAQALGLETLNRMKGVIDDPAPSAIVAALGDSNVLLQFFGWVDQRAASYAKVASEAHRLVKIAFDDAGVDMPPPGYELFFDALPEPAPARPPAARKEPESEQGAAPEEIDVAPESDIEDQIEDELARAEEPNLLEDR